MNTTISLDKIPTNFGNFKGDLALELLRLVKEAHHRYDRAKQDPSWHWENDLNSITIDGTQYDILANLGFAQYFFLRRRRVPFGFIAKKHNTQDIFVVFRGTMNPAEWISNFKFTQDCYEEVDNPKLPQQKQTQLISLDQLGRIHRGFYRTYTRPDLGGIIDQLYHDFNPYNNQVSIRNKVEEVLSDREKCPPHSRIFVTGHSLGGALATLSALHIYLSKAIPFDRPILYTFANPRVGDRTFAQHFQALECYRIANSEDIVPMLPIPSLLLAASRVASRSTMMPASERGNSRLDYQHIGIPIYFTVQRGNIPENHIISTYLEAFETAATPTPSVV